MSALNPPTRPDVRERLADLREARKEHREAQEELYADIRRAVRAAQKAGVPMAEIARILDMDRSSVYRTYVQTAA